jgi:hypothetical protein
MMVGDTSSLAKMSSINVDATNARRSVRAAIVRLRPKHPAAVARLVNCLVLQHKVLRVDTPALAA